MLRPHHNVCSPRTILYFARLIVIRIDVSRRLRRAILLNDLSLVKRIIQNNPQKLRNPDFEDKSNTSLHIAAKYGFTQIAEFLIEQGHEEEMVSRNNDFETPLMLASAAGKEDMGVTLAKRFPDCIPWQDKAGLDALMLSCKSGAGTLHLIPTLILHGPSILTSSDISGNTALHHASAAGELKALRMLLQFGANPLASNAYSWTPVHYSATPAAEAYFKTLIIEFEKKKAEGKREMRERERQRTAGVRLVTDQEGLAIAGLPAPGMEWSPVEKRRAMTPTESRGWTFTPDGMRPRAETGESI
ncbi:ankyrin [Ophiobolus disseminans]|uniref:Ankyrin n=1 Tax=Ophiobolus disseminans TaxID=1469910 RepID=A0A6A6ZEW6_9PLEO|nr:ankyrin [Ophiobolus disseminans]